MSLGTLLKGVLLYINLFVLVTHICYAMINYLDVYLPICSYFLVVTDCACSCSCAGELADLLFVIQAHLSTQTISDVILLSSVTELFEADILRDGFCSFTKFLSFLASFSFRIDTVILTCDTFSVCHSSCS